MSPKQKREAGALASRARPCAQYVLCLILILIAHQRPAGTQARLDAGTHLPSRSPIHSQRSSTSPYYIHAAIVMYNIAMYKYYYVTEQNPRAERRVAARLAAPELFFFCCNPLTLLVVHSAHLRCVKYLLLPTMAIAERGLGSTPPLQSFFSLPLLAARARVESLDSGLVVVMLLPRTPTGITCIRRSSSKEWGGRLTGAGRGAGTTRGEG